ncbi:MAG: hypothetical protein IPG89_06075 [Bacteroidetes bacterium]|nr:hypothetical protein [Bacteroidota bacterium]
MAFYLHHQLSGHWLIKNDVEEILENAPCEGNYNFYPNYPSGDHWGASCFLDRPDKLWKKETCSGFLGEYAGLDYLLLHNLYYYVREFYPFYNYSERELISDMPYSNGEFSLVNKKTIGAFEFIEANNAVIHSTGAADYRAGKQVDLQPGFTAENGSDFHAYVDPYNCSGVSDQMSRSSFRKLIK